MPGPRDRESERRHCCAVFLDRDGVLNRAIVRDGRPFPPRSLDEMELLPGVEEACRELKAHGLMLIVVTNQPDIARGTSSAASVDDINEALRHALSLDEISVCPHDDADGCGCRKPKPGLLLRAADRHSIDLGRSVMVGDRWRDVEAGRSAGCRTVFIDYGYDERRPDSYDRRAVSLAESMPFLLSVTSDEERP